MNYDDRETAAERENRILTLCLAVCFWILMGMILFCGIASGLGVLTGIFWKSFKWTIGA